MMIHPATPTTYPRATYPLRHLGRTWVGRSKRPHNPSTHRLSPTHCLPLSPTHILALPLYGEERGGTGGEGAEDGTGQIRSVHRFTTLVACVVRLPQATDMRRARKSIASLLSRITQGEGEGQCLQSSSVQLGLTLWATQRGATSQGAGR